ncbi:Uncharacterised protein [Mycobacterium tuberculosis]|nr:Uncharacterised protein [Mycobacterium tuberculosis]
MIAQKRRGGAGFADHRLGDLVETQAGCAGSRCRTDRPQRGGNDGARRGHRVEFAGTALRHDPATPQPCQWAHDYFPRARNARANTSSMVPTASTVFNWSR